MLFLNYYRACETKEKKIMLEFNGIPTRQVLNSYSVCVEYCQTSPFLNPSPHLYLAQVFPDFNNITKFWTAKFYYLSAAKLTPKPNKCSTFILACQESTVTLPEAFSPSLLSQLATIGFNTIIPFGLQIFLLRKIAVGTISAFIFSSGPHISELLCLLRPSRTKSTIGIPALLSSSFAFSSSLFVDAFSSSLFSSTSMPLPHRHPLASIRKTK
ncbi:hypothetical protein OUZ56_014581 [Daphnia magna]|uniref:Uncharacterized protein n=1 Tax=Daphnia magna TaxID=35525 RepID=A0ABR0AK72_9CRUS|nr:hypothetical protein OUZ56_014581 [Daphnia magna]